MNLRKVFLIAKREFLFNFRRRSFLFTAFGIPLITIGAMVIIFSLFAQQLESISGFKAIGIVDQAKVIVDEAGRPTITLPSLFRVVASEEQAAAELRSGAIDGYYVLPSDYLRTARIDAYNRPSLALNEGVEDELEKVIKTALAAKVGDPALAERIQDPVKNLSIYRLGYTQRLDATALIANIFVPSIFSLVIFMAITVTSQFLMSGMAEEKENRMMELFVTSTRPSEMLWGKILGLGALGLAQITVWSGFGLAYAATRGTDLGQALAGFQVTPGILAMMLAYFVLGYALFGAIMAGIGASVNAEQEGRQISGILGTIGVLPFFFFFTYFTDPNGTIPVILSMVPVTSPVGMILRVFWANVPTGEILISLGILMLSVDAMIWVAGRIFRLGMLNYGRRLGVRDIIRAIREGRRTMIASRRANQVKA
jgi:ABC-2 type transport system permease protein